jgi:hypothetical protein
MGIGVTANGLGRWAMKDNEGLAFVGALGCRYGQWLSITYRVLGVLMRNAYLIIPFPCFYSVHLSSTTRTPT